MKALFPVVIIAVMSCCSPKKANRDINTNSDNSIIDDKAVVDSTITVLPACIKKLILQFQQEEKQSPPRNIYRYIYNGKTVYFVPAICCDFYSDLYDSNCNIIGHPDGGFTGRGDGTATDFIKTRTGEKLIWKDERK